MNVRVKVCGVTTADALEAAVVAGADAVGFVMSPSPREVDALTARRLAALLPPWVASVVVTRNPAESFVRNVLADVAPHWWQTDRADLESVAPPRGTRALPVIREGDDVARLPDAFVYEGRSSGSGETVDWQAAAALARRGRLVLAGGLDADNVADAIRIVRPWGVDASSGLERERGRKDPALITRFVRAARAAARELETQR